MEQNIKSNSNVSSETLSISSILLSSSGLPSAAMSTDAVMPSMVVADEWAPQWNDLQSLVGGEDFNEESELAILGSHLYSI